MGEVMREVGKLMRNAKENAHSGRPRDHATRAQQAKSRGKTRVSSGPESRHEMASPRTEVAPPAVEEIGNDGRIRSALDTMLSKSLERDDKGRFVHGHVTTGAESRGFFDDLAPVKADIVTSVRAQLAADHDDAPPTLLALIDAFAEAHLLRKATFMQLASRGGPITNKGRVRGLLAAWGSFFDREIRAAERLGLQRQSRPVAESPREWLEQSASTAEVMEGETDKHS